MHRRAISMGGEAAQEAEPDCAGQVFRQRVEFGQEGPAKVNGDNNSSLPGRGLGEFLGYPELPVTVLLVL